MPIGRREFVKTFAAGAGLGALAAAAPPARAQDDTESFAFCVVADPHCAEEPKPGIERLGRGVDKFLACARKMEALEGPERPDFMLVAGDIHPAALKDRIDDLGVTAHVVAGNHESDRKTRQLLRNLFPHDFAIDDKPSDYYSFVHKGVRFIAACDAGQGGDHIGHFCSEGIIPRGQCEWLEQQLAQPERRILFAHIPPDPHGRDVEMRLARNDARWFSDLVRRTRPEVMFFGHLHEPTQEYVIGETPCFNIRSCCWNFRRAPLGFVHVTVTRSGIVTREILTGAYEGVQ